MGDPQAVRWTDPWDRRVRRLDGPLTLDQRIGRAYIHTWSGAAGASRVGILDTRDGRLLRLVTVSSAPSGGAGALGLDARDGRVFAAVDGDAATGTTASVTTLDARIGETVGRLAIPVGPVDLTVDARTRRVVVTSVGAAAAPGQPAVPPSVSVLDTRAGRLLRVQPAGADTPLVVEDARVGRWLVFDRRGAAPGGTVAVVDARAGRLVRRVALAAAPWRVVVDAETHRAFALSGAGVSILDTHDGRFLRSAPVGAAPAAIALDTRTGRVFASSTPFSPGGAVLGAVTVLDAASGQVVRRLSIAGNPTTLTVDAWRGRVLVTDAGRIDARGQPTGSGPSTCWTRAPALVRAVPLRGIPGEVAIEEGTGRVVVASGAPPGATFPDPWGWVAGLRRGLLFPRVPTPSPHPIGGSVSLLDLSR